MTGGEGEVAPAVAPKRAKRRPTIKPTCPECGQPFETRTLDRFFCSEAHRATFHNRSSKVGRALVPLAMAWRLARNAGNSAEGRAKRAAGGRILNEMVRLLDAACADDREAGRMSKLDYVMRRTRLQDGLRYENETVAFHEAAIAKEKADAAAAKGTATPKPKESST